MKKICSFLCICLAVTANAKQPSFMYKVVDKSSALLAPFVKGNVRQEDTTAGNPQIEICDITGRNVLSQTLSAEPINIASLAQGTYFVFIVANGKRTQTKQLIVVE